MEKSEEGEEMLIVAGIGIGVMVMSLFSANAYEKGFKDAKRYVDDE
jgi:hypothetical protein